MFVKDNPFYDYTTAIRSYSNMQIAKIILAFYKNNFQNKKIKTLIIYHALNLAILWFINTIKYCKRFAFVYFMSNSFFTK